MLPYEIYTGFIEILSLYSGDPGSFSEIFVNDIRNSRFTHYVNADNVSFIRNARRETTNYDRSLPWISKAVVTQFEVFLSIRFPYV